MADEFTLSVSGKKHSGWTDLQITRSLDQLAHSFTVRLTDKWTDQGERIQIIAGNEVKVEYGSQLVITGYVDDDTMNYDATQRSISITGRSKTGDLVDCAALRANKKRSWRKVGLLSIARDICQPFGIDVVTSDLVGNKFNRFTIEEGETAFACLSRAARMRGLLMVTTPEGDLRFARAGTDKVKPPIQFGENVLSCSHRRSLRDRFSEYRVKTQVAGTDELNAKQVTIRRTSEDEGVPRYRPTIIMADDEDNGSELQKRADWEKNVRAGQSRSLTYVVRGWENESGLWEPNTLVRVIDPQNWLDDELLISTVTFSRSLAGTTTSLTVTEARAYDVQPLFPKPAAQKKKDNFLGGLFS